MPSPCWQQAFQPFALVRAAACTRITSFFWLTGLNVGIAMSALQAQPTATPTIDQSKRVTTLTIWFRHLGACSYALPDEPTARLKRDTMLGSSLVPCCLAALLPCTPQAFGSEARRTSTQTLPPRIRSGSLLQHTRPRVGNCAPNDIPPALALNS